MSTISSFAVEKPRNGLAGLKHWRSDLVAGLVVSLVSLPFSLGIAVASGAPPVCGLISAIIAGLVLPFLGGSYVTVSGPAAGLAPALFAGMLLLGHGDLSIGYPLLLVAISLTGAVQIVLARLQLARFSAIFPASVVEGMLASIGLLIIAKQLPLILGVKYQAHEFWGILAETPKRFIEMDTEVFFTGIFCLALIFMLSSIKSKWVKIVPPQVIAAVVGLIIGRYLGLGGDRLILIPDHPFRNGFQLPNFAGVIADRSIWKGLATTVLTLTLIDGVESLATIAAIDKIDPFRRKSDPNRTLQAMGVSNLCSSLAGGLTIIPGGVKSTTCILSGGRTQWANFYNALFLTIYLLLGRNVINMMPYAALGSIVLYTGYKLCSPKVWRHVARIGGEQLSVFAITILVTVSTDLLWGIAAGMLAKMILELAIVSNVERRGEHGSEPVLKRAIRRFKQTSELFRDPVVKGLTVGDHHYIFFGRPLVCFNSLLIDSNLKRIPSGVSKVFLHVTDLVTIVDHTTATALLEFVEHFAESGRGVATIIGMDRLKSKSGYHASMRIGRPLDSARRNEAIVEIARSNHPDGAEFDPRAFLESIAKARLEVIPRRRRHPMSKSFIILRRYMKSKRKARSGVVRRRSRHAGEARLEAEAGVREGIDLAAAGLVTDDAKAEDHRDADALSLSKHDQAPAEGVHGHEDENNIM